MLLFQGRHNRHNPFRKATAGLALGAETAFAPQHAGSDQPLGQVIGRLDPFNMDEGPQGGFAFEDVPTGRCRLGVGAGGTEAEQFPHFGLHGLHLFLKGRAGYSAIANLRPPVKHQAGLGQEGFAHGLGRATALDERLKVTEEVGPTELT